MLQEMCHCGSTVPQGASTHKLHNFLVPLHDMHVACRIQLLKATGETAIITMHLPRFDTRHKTSQQPDTAPAAVSSETENGASFLEHAMLALATMQCATRFHPLWRPCVHITTVAALLTYMPVALANQTGRTQPPLNTLPQNTHQHPRKHTIQRQEFTTHAHTNGGTDISSAHDMLQHHAHTALWHSG